MLAAAEKVLLVHDYPAASLVGFELMLLLHCYPAAALVGLEAHLGAAGHDAGLVAFGVMTCFGVASQGRLPAG